MSVSVVEGAIHAIPQALRWHAFADRSACSIELLLKRSALFHSTGSRLSRLPSLSAPVPSVNSPRKTRLDCPKYPVGQPNMLDVLQQSSAECCDILYRSTRALHQFGPRPKRRSMFDWTKSRWKFAYGSALEYALLKPGMPGTRRA